MNEIEELNHADREHSKYSASGSERWLNCSASVEIEESCPPSPDSEWSKEGTRAHEALELNLLVDPSWTDKAVDSDGREDIEMIGHVKRAATVIRSMAKGPNKKLIVERRVYNNDIHEEMFGTVDVIIPEYYVRLNIGDFKFGAGHIVNPVRNTQLIQYALAVAESYDWDEKLFPEVAMHIFQPRAGKNWHKSWTITMKELKEHWLPLWHKGIARIEGGNTRLFEGSWCHWCRGRIFAKCPKKQEKRDDKVKNLFESNPLTSEVNDNGFKESGEESRQKGYKKSNPFLKEDGKKSGGKEIKTRSKKEDRKVVFAFDAAEAQESESDFEKFDEVED